MPVAKEGYPFIFSALGLALLFGLLGLSLLAFFFLFLTLFVVYFFRDPVRTIPEGNNCIVAPADGRVVFAERIFEERYLKKEVLKVSIFMSLFNVHVNRSPSDGVIVNKKYNPGRFISANKEKASLDNEQCFYHIGRDDDKDIGMVQIAGLVARRIVSYKNKSDRVKKGEKIGLIRFGSRVDLFLPLGVNLIVERGSRVYGGCSIIGEIDNP